MAFTVPQTSVSAKGGRSCWAIGVDPGHHGGAGVLIDPAMRVVSIEAWTSPPFGLAIARLVSGAPHRPLAGLERIVPNRQRLKGLVTLSEAAGGPLDALRCAGIEPKRPTANEWRRDLLGLGTVSAEVAERVALQAVRGERQQGRRWSVVLPLTYPTTCGHTAEAICIALWAAGWRVTAPRSSK